MVPYNLFTEIFRDTQLGPLKSYICIDVNVITDLESRSIMTTFVRMITFLEPKPSRRGLTRSVHLHEDFSIHILQREDRSSVQRLFSYHTNGSQDKWTGKSGTKSENLHDAIFDTKFTKVKSKEPRT